MSTKGKVLLGAGALLLVIVALTFAFLPMPKRGPLLPRALPLVVTPQLGGLTIINKTEATKAVPPLRPTTDPLYTAGSRYALGYERLIGMTSVWNTEPTGCGAVTCTNYNLDWSWYDESLTDAANYTITLSSGQVVSQPVSLGLPARWLQRGSGSGTYDDPYGLVYAPDWLHATQAFTYTYNGANYVYWGINYDDPLFLARMKNFVAEAGARYNSNSQVALVRVALGVDDEAQPVGLIGPGSQTQLLVAHESQVASAAAYKAFVRELCEAAYTAFPNKPVVCLLGTSPTSSTSSRVFRQELWSIWQPLGKHIGLGISSLWPDSGQADDIPAAPIKPWREFLSGVTVASYGDPVAFEFWHNASISGDPWGLYYWTTVAGAGNAADFILPDSSWANYRTTYAWDIADYWLGGYDKRAWLIAREAEYPMRSFAAEYGESGRRGTYGNYLAVPTPENYKQYCTQALIDAARVSAASGGTLLWQPCGIVTPSAGATATPHILPSPVATLQATPSADASGETNMMQRLFNRQALRAEAGTTFPVTLDTGWMYADSMQDVVLTISYLDIGSSTFGVSINTYGTLTDTHTITRTNTGLWQRATWTVLDATLNNDLPYDGKLAFLLVQPVTDPLYLHELYFDVLGDLPTATPTPAGWTPSPTPSRTLTPTPTPTATTAWVTIEPATTPTPDYWWDSMEGTPPGHERTFDGAVPTGTPTPGYWPILTPNATQFVDGVQSYKIEPACSPWVCWANGGLRLTTQYTPTHGIYSTHIYVHNWKSNGGITCYVAPVYADGKYFYTPTGTYVNTNVWGLTFNDFDCHGTVAFTTLNLGTPEDSTLSMTVTTGIWYPVQVVWDIHSNPGKVNTFTITVGTTTDVITKTSDSITRRVAGVTDIYEGAYGSYLYGSRPVLSFDDAFLIENSVVTPGPAATYTPVVATVTPVPTATRTATPTITPTPGGYLTPTPSGYYDATSNCGKIYKPNSWTNPDGSWSWVTP
jgi:hypothetical protein